MGGGVERELILAGENNTRLTARCQWTTKSYKLCRILIFLHFYCTCMENLMLYYFRGISLKLVSLMHSYATSHG